MMIKSEDRTMASTIATDVDDPAKYGSANAPLPKCVCSWKNCRAYQKAFREARHEVFDGVIKIKLIKGHMESMAYKECLDRTLGVSSKEPDWKPSNKPGGSPHCKYNIARHHFTEKHLRKYDSNPKTFSFVKPFSLHGAKKYLYTLNPRETFQADDAGGPVDPSEALYLQCPNVTSEVVKAEYRKVMEVLRDRQRGSKSVNKFSGGTVSDDRSVGTSASNLAELKLKEAENKLLKDQLDAMKSQLTFLHDMVEKLQAQHFDTASVYSRGSRKNHHASSRSRKKSTVRRKSTVPDEINFDDDDTESHTLVSQWNENDYGSGEEDDEKTHATTGTFQSRFKQPLPPHDDEESEEEDEDDYDYNDCISLGASTILTASKSVKSLPRELELDEDDEDSDSHESLEEEAFESRSVCSSYHQSTCSSQHSRGTFGTFAKPSKQQKEPDMIAAPVGRRRSIASSTTSSSMGGNLYEVTALVVTDPYGEKGTYTGSISKSTGMPHGHGRLEYDEAGRWYEGDWKHGRWTGFGRLSNGDGDFYEGGLKNDHKHGRGIMKFSDGRTFEGVYVNGQMVEGKMTYQDGSTYEGTWVEGMRHGYGRCVFTDESIYEGEFKEGEFFGRGKMTWNDGGWYEGEWVNGEMHGRGREIRADGSLRHEGEWVKGQPVRRKKK